MKITASATIGGKKTNRIKVKRAPGRKLDTSPQRAVRRHFHDPASRGKTYVTTCISMPVEDLVLIDEFAELAQMSRSRFVREAAKRFGHFIRHGNSDNQERMWREAMR
jgi:hypothetical protein